MIIHSIRSLDDSRIDHYRNLKDRELARGGRFIAEGEHVVRRLLASEYSTESVLLAHRKLDRMAQILPKDQLVYVVEDRLIHEIVGFKFHCGIIACGRRSTPKTLDQLLPPAEATSRSPLTIVICPELINHENVGSLIRIAAGFGADLMLLGGRSCDPFWRRSVRVSMGAVFHLPILRCDDLGADLVRLKTEWGVQLAGAVLDTRAERLNRATRPDRLALMFGSEAQGLPDGYVRHCDRRITIPMRLGTDSLNVAVSAAVFLYHFTEGMPIRSVQPSQDHDSPA